MTSSSATTGSNSITVLGLGPMGQSMARVLVSNGHRVTVWNRTPRKADGVLSAGAVWADTPTQAVEDSELIIISLTDYHAMWDILGGSVTSLKGRTLVNLSSDTPDMTRKASAWVMDHGGSFVSGGMMVPAEMVGTSTAYAYYSGDERAFEAHRSALDSLGSSRFMGDDPGRAQIMYQANLDVFLTALAGFAHAIALVGSAGITAEMFLPETLKLFEAIPTMIAPDGIQALGSRIDAGDHPGESSSVIMMGATADHIVATSSSVGIDTQLPRAIQELYRRAIDGGYGSEGWTRTIDSIRGRGGAE